MERMETTSNVYYVNTIPEEPSDGLQDPDEDNNIYAVARIVKPLTHHNQATTKKMTEPKIVKSFSDRWNQNKSPYVNCNQETTTSKEETYAKLEGTSKATVRKTVYTKLRREITIWDKNRSKSLESHSLFSFCVANLEKRTSFEFFVFSVNF